MSFDNLLGGPPATLLPPDDAAGPLAHGDDPEQVATEHPASSLAWAVIAEQALRDGRDLHGYAFARVGYHRGLDALRRNGWKGQGPVPWSHEPNQGFLRCLAALALGSQRIGDHDEAERCTALLVDCDPEAPRSPTGDAR
ncbi:MAG: DUF3151 domain-containing protein [Nocardioidaceae bacterium]|nr:DUF3151 domain-containing protein [Nocardioidaceae bacterium]